MIKDIRELNFPGYATLSHAECNIQDMAEGTITTQVKIDGQITPDFSYDWAVEFQGAKYIMPIRKPQAAKENASLNSTGDLVFQHWAVYQLKRWYFFTVQSVGTGRVLPYKYAASVGLNLKNFCTLFGQVLNFYYGDTITIDLNPEWKYSAEPVTIEISYSYIWDVLIRLYELYAVRWQIEPIGDIDHYVIKVGYPTTEISHIFEYGFKGGLLKVERQVQNDNIRNMLLGRGGEKNLPYRYYKDVDPDNPSFPADPDWIPELADYYFTELYGATFRSYIQGWKAKHYPEETVTTPTADKAYAPWAWMRGYTDAEFCPVEYVADEYTTADNGYGVGNGSSIAKYGPLQGGLENNSDIYPTIQGIEVDGLGRIDEIVDVQPIVTDEVVEPEPSTSRVETLDDIIGETTITETEFKDIEVESATFAIAEGEYGNFDEGDKYLELSYDKFNWVIHKVDGKWTGEAVNTQVLVDEYNVEIIDAIITIIDTVTGKTCWASGIGPGTYKARVKLKLYNLSAQELNVRVKLDNVKITAVKLPSDEPVNTWSVWVKNLFGTEKLSSETNTQYAERVWRPILGDRIGTEAKIVFSSGWLSTSEDYEFVITDIPEYDSARTYTDAAGNTYTSHWRIPLGKSDADLEATGLYVPSTKRQARVGDRFFFVGIDMPQMYVSRNEIRLDDWKKDELEKTREIKPSWVVKLDKVRIHNYGEAKALVEQLRVGNSFTLFDKRFIDGSHQEQLYLQSITYRYDEPTDREANLLPDVEVILSDKYEVVASPVETLQGEVEAIQRQLGSISNVEQIVRKTGDKIYLRKDKSDRAAGHIDFLQGLDSYKRGVLREGAQFGASFAEGLSGFGGYINQYGDGWLGGLHLRNFLEVPELRYNRIEISIGNDWNAPGGGIVEKVEPDYDSNGIIQRTGTITLHLEDGEIGAVAEDDICQGIFHDGFNPSNNATQDEDDGRGNFRFAGFHTVYFRITEIIETSRNSVFRYMIRAVSDRWKDSFHPSAQMHFVGYGNFTNKQRRTSKYSTRTYERYLRDVNDWEFTDANIGAQFGDLSNLSIFGLDMSGYSAYLNNIYMSGRIHQLNVNPLYMVIDYENDNLISYGETKTITCRVFRGFEDVTSEVVKWSVTRDSGITQDDAAWLLKPKVQNFAGTLDICFDSNENDIGNNDNSISTLFTFTAELPGADSPVTHQLIF